MTSLPPDPAYSEFFKVSGGGNDFIAFVDPAEVPSVEEIRLLCRRGLSVGADGVFFLRRAGNRVEMTHFNSDGSAAALCLNGTRCAARLALELGWAVDTVTLATGAGTIRGENAGPNRIRLHLPPPEERPEPFETFAGGRLLKGWRTVVGVPHLVLPWTAGLEDAPVLEAGADLVHHDVAGPGGANVNFVYPAAGHRFDVRTFERGVENETLACGTGVMASAQVLAAVGEGEMPLAAQTAGGAILEVDGVLRDGQVQVWSLTGDARVVYQGRLKAAALDQPKPPRWSSPSPER